MVTDVRDEDETELNLVLSTRSLRWVTTIDYGHYGPPRQNSILRGHDGRWRTYDWRAGIAVLWELDPANPETQPTLFDTP